MCAQKLDATSPNMVHVELLIPSLLVLRLAGSSSERKACDNMDLQKLLAFGNKLGWRSDAIRANHFQSFGYTLEGFQEFLGLESVLVEEVRVPSGVARSWAWCRSCLAKTGSSRGPAQ